MVYSFVTFLNHTVDLVNDLVYNKNMVIEIVKDKDMTEQLNINASRREQDDINELRNQVKSMIVARGYTMDKLAEELNARYGTKESKANLSNKLKRGSLRYIDMERICDVLGYYIDIKQHRTDRDR